MYSIHIKSNQCLKADLIGLFKNKKTKKKHIHTGTMNGSFLH